MRFLDNASLTRVRRISLVLAHTVGTFLFIAAEVGLKVYSLYDLPTTIYRQGASAANALESRGLLFWYPFCSGCTECRPQMCPPAKHTS